MDSYSFLWYTISIKIWRTYIMAKAKPLYKELIKQAHPDKHPNNKDVAEELTAMINNNRFNYRELLKIKDLVNDKLV